MYKDLASLIIINHFLNHIENQIGLSFIIESFFVLSFGLANHRSACMTYLIYLNVTIFIQNKMLYFFQEKSSFMQLK